MSFNKKTWIADEELTEKEMNDLEDRTDEAFKNIQYFMADIVDYVIEADSSENQRWRKWQSGLMEQWVKGTVTSDDSVGQFALRFRYPFKEVPINSGTLRSMDSSYDKYILHRVITYSGSLDHVTFSVSRPDKGRLGSLELEAYATGRWK